MDWLTPEELARITGYSRQTINKWIKREKWTTSPKPGVQGGKARTICIDDNVKNFIKLTRHASEISANYNVKPNSLHSLLLNSIQQMSSKEQDKLSALLLREGIKGLLERLNVDDN